jgi:hypothetical protein
MVKEGANCRGSVGAGKQLQVLSRASKLKSCYRAKITRINVTNQIEACQKIPCICILLCVVLATPILF